MRQAQEVSNSLAIDKCVILFILLPYLYLILIQDVGGLVP